MRTITLAMDILSMWPKGYHHRVQCHHLRLWTDWIRENTLHDGRLHKPWHHASHHQVCCYLIHPPTTNNPSLTSTGICLRGCQWLRQWKLMSVAHTWRYTGKLSMTSWLQWVSSFFRRIHLHSSSGRTQGRRTLSFENMAEAGLWLRVLWKRRVPTHCLYHLNSIIILSSTNSPFPVLSFFTLFSRGYSMRGIAWTSFALEMRQSTLEQQWVPLCKYTFLNL